MTAPSDKTTLRRRMRRARRAHGPARRVADAARIAALVDALPDVRRARTVLCYVSFRGEVATHDLIRGWIGEGRTVAVPRVEGDQLEARVLVRWDALVPGVLGIPTSDGPPPSEPIEVCITPGLAFARSGARLGYGGGFYDRYFAAHPGVVAVGLCYGFQLLDGVPTGPTDRPVQVVVTPDGALRTG